MADNVTGLRDEDGTLQDWIEIHNASTSPLNLTGYYLTDNVLLRTQWQFPSVTLAPGEFLLVWASGKDRRVAGQPLHTNFSLDKSGEYLALVQPNGTTVVQQFSPAFPKQDPDRAFGVLFNRAALVASGANADYQVPTTAGGLAANWKTAATTPAGWTLAKPMGLGFGFSVPGMTQTIRAKNTATGFLDTQGDAITLLNRPTGHSDILNEQVSVVPMFNLLGQGGDGRYGSNSTPPSWALDDYVAVVRGTISITTAGVYTFGLNSDDGGRITINGNIVMDDPTLHGPADFLGQVTLPAGLHTIEAFFWERGGGDHGELFAAQGAFTSWGSQFRLVGDVAGGGLPVSTTPLGTVGGGGVVGTNIESTMRNVNASAFARVAFPGAAASGFTSLSLLMRYNDGFQAHLNGTLVAAASAPTTPSWNSTAMATRASDVSQQWIGYNVTSALSGLASGSNVLALQGMNSAATDSTFLLSAQLVAGSVQTPLTTGFFNIPSPGGVNGEPSSLGKVADTVFLPKRGFYPNTAVTAVPFPVTITSATPGATIRYTLDGSMPSATNGTVYTGPISITQTSTLRAMAYRTGWESTNVDTNTYIVLDDVLQQSPTGAAPATGWPAPVTSGAQVIDYGMDPDIVNNANPAIGGVAQVKSALMAIPSVSIVTPLPGLFDAATGIYVNPYNRGLAWERAASIEILNDPNGNFQANCGIRMRGGFSRSTDNPKHSWHVYFRGEYGDGKLKFPLFGYDGAEEFNQFDIRTAQNYSWSFGGDGNNTFLREELTRQMQLDMGYPGSHIKYFHLYLNGQYWGLHNTDERKEADHCSTYIGGRKEDWDIIKCEQDSGYITGITDGRIDDWHLLFTKANPLTAAGTYTRRALTLADYYDMQGLAADGVTPNASPVLLDVTSLIDYMLITFWTGNLDGATSAFLGDSTANNWFAGRDRTKRRGFLYFVHDFEHTFFNTAEDRTGPFNRTFTDLNTYNEKRTYYNPMFLHADLLDIPEYKKAWQLRVQKHLFNGGVLSPAANTARLNKLAAVVDTAIIAESARWGDAKTATPLNRTNWQAARDYIVNSYLPNRTATVISQLRADGLYPAIDGVTISPPGGYIPSTAAVNLTIPATSGQTIYYTTNGQDPLLPNGTLNPTAQIFVPGGVVKDDLITSGSSWRYRDPSIDLGSSDIVVGNPAYNSTNWKHPLFDVSNTTIWKTGNAELGNGDTADSRPEATMINLGPANARFPALYFRRQFNVTRNAADYSALELEGLIDDGAIFYINGQEVARLNMPTGAVTHTYSGLGAINEAAFVPVTDSRLVGSVLTPGANGQNTIAVQVHQANANSSDLSFDLRLRGTRIVPNSTIPLSTGSVVVNARAVETATNNWSSLSTAVFLVNSQPASSANLVVSELHYRPLLTSADVAAGTTDENQLEYIELLNISNQPVDLQGIRIVSGATFTWNAEPRLLAPGSRVVIAGNAASFTTRYGSAPQAVFTGQLANGGERILILAANGTTLRDFTYDDLAPWPSAADGTGPSLVLMRPEKNPDHAVATNWRASYGNGAPGMLDSRSYATWKPANAPGQADTADADKDGLTTVWEYLLGGSPTANNSQLLPSATTEVIAGQPYELLHVTLQPGVDDAVLAPQSSTDLRIWDSAEMQLHEEILEENGARTFIYRHDRPVGADGRRFFRLTATLLP
jgi:hypothetical protein